MIALTRSTPTTDMIRLLIVTGAIVKIQETFAQPILNKWFLPDRVSVFSHGLNI